MSFSAEVKNELLSAENAPCCEFAQNYALLLFGRAFSASGISLLTEHEGVANAYSAAAGGLSGEEITPVCTAAGKYKISLEKKSRIQNIFAKTASSGASLRRINFANIENPCCFQAFIRGAFLSCGTVTDPEKEYHLEFSVPTKGLCDDLKKLFDEFEPTPKSTLRGGAHIIYFKNSTDIEDVLSLMGATENSMKLMGAKMFKDIRNTVNRKVNFENANLARSIAAAAKQYEAISIIKEKGGLASLPEELREIARLRLEDRQASSAEIVKMLSESITVSGVNHRFKRIMDIAGRLQEKE